MFKIKPLNKDSISDDDGPIIRKEAQEENALGKYNKALKLQCSSQLEEAENLLQSLLETDIPEIENKGGLPKTMSTLKYSCYLNVGSIANLLGKKQKALDYYIQASDLDKTDVTLWFKIGTLALELDHFKQAAYALSKGLEYNKNHWPSLDKLITILYAMRDNISCLHFISKGLQLDPNYIRGLVLRKRIYERNPGTKDYYQLFNPDYVYDPPLDVQFDEEEGIALEKESDKISERIRTLELELEPKPLPVLPLSKPLEEFTWISLGQSITHMYRYINEQKMSFMCRINLIENIKENNNDKNVPEIEMDEPEEKVENDEGNEMETAEVENENVFEVSEAPEVPSDDTEPEAEKEEKTINENDADNEEDSKSNSQDQADGQECEVEAKKPEEEKSSSEGTDKQNDCKSESTEEKSKSKTPNRRRRNSLSFLQPWAWHSKRKSSRKMGKYDKDDTIEGALRRIIPINILPKGLKSDRYKEISDLQQDDSVNTMDLYKLFVEEEQVLDSPQPIINDSEEEQYFGTQTEKEDIETFWKYEWERCDVIALIEKFVKILATKWEVKWPSALKSIYIDAYEMYRSFFDHPQYFIGEEDFETFKTDTEITLLYSELIFDQVQECINHNLSLTNIKHLPSTSLNIMELVCTRKTDWGENYLKINIRLNWMKANIYMVENKNDLAIRALNAIMYFINNFAKTEEEYYLKLPNCVHNSLITKRNSEKLLQSLEILQKLGYVEKLYENKCYNEVIEILKETFQLKLLSKYKIKIDRPVQIVMLLHALWLTDRQECLIWTEICLNEALPMYFKTHAQPDSFEHKRWTLVVVKCMVMMEACIKEENIIILDNVKETQTRLVENLTSIICHQLNSKNIESNTKMSLESIKPWILLHYILQREEHRVQAKRKVPHCKNSDDSDDEQNISIVTKSDSEEDDEQDVPASIQILFSAHDFLGRKNWCLANNGELLLFLVQVVLYRLNAPIFEGIREKIDIHLEQAFFCLYQHPSKKNKVSRHLADHNVDPLSLTWEHAQHLYEFYQPKALPEFDSYRFSSISNEMEQLLLRILALVPPNYDPQFLLQKVTNYVNGQAELMPDPIIFPHKVSAIYYLLGDYYLKLHDPTKAQKYFLLDLCINPSRLDTWADMALGMASQLETKLNHCETFKNESDFLDKVRSAQICFKQSLQISNGHAMLWIEYGNFVYMAHSFCSRLLKGDTDTFSMEKFEILESQKEALLDTAMECFTAANIAWHIADPGEHDERWLHHYMLGKISEKKKQDPSNYLEHYSKAGKLLFENKATYPLKINYSNPQHLSMEALEVHYRIHASILKYLELHEDKPISRATGRVFQKYLKDSNNGLFSKSIHPRAEPNLKRPSAESDQAYKKRRYTLDDIDSDIANVMEELLTKVEENLKPKENDVVMIIDSDEDCISRKNFSMYQSTPEASKYPRIRVKNAQEIMDDMMKKSSENQTEYKDSETDPENEMKTASTENIQKQTESASSPSRRGSTTSTAATTTTTTSDSSDSSSSDDSDSSSSDSESSETESSKQSNVSGKKSDDSPLTTEEIKKLIDQCLLSLEQCISRFPQNYKALYRLTHFYLNNKSYRNLNKCRQLMLSEYQCSDSTVVTGLFSDRKTSNFFNGVWRIPTSEIDRPGSFASHMSRCVQLLMQVLRDSDDHKTLLDLCLLLRRTPDPDKIYIRDSERQQLSDQALSICIQSIRGLIKKFTTTKNVSDTLEGDSNVKLIMDIYKSYQKVQKHLTHKETVFAGLLTEVYKHMQNKLPEGSNVLEAAVKFCQQRKAATRFSGPQTPTNVSVVKQSPQPVTPQSPTQTVPVQPIKKPSKSFPGRPRGRPPNINKHLTGMKSKSRDSNFFSSNPFPWQSLLYPPAMGANIDPKLALNYMMSKYQEQFMRQYSQLGQNSLLTNPFAMNPIMGSSNVLPSLPTQNVEKKTVETPKPKGPEKKESNVRYSKEINKTYYAEPNKDIPGDISIFKDRPGISITPIHQNPVTKPHVPSSPGKTLQQKLAERQKQNPAVQKPKSSSKHESSATDYFNQYQNFSHIFAKPNVPLPPVPHSSKLMAPKIPSYKNLSNIPSSLTITKSQPQSSLTALQADSGISISQITPTYKNPTSFRKPTTPKLKLGNRKLGNDITVTPSEPKKDVPLSLSKKDSGKKTENVEIITIE